MSDRFRIEIAKDAHRGFRWTLTNTFSEMLVAHGFAADKPLAQRVADAVQKLMEMD